MAKMKKNSHLGNNKWLWTDLPVSVKKVWYILRNVIKRKIYIT